MANLLADKIRQWRGRLSLKEAAAALDVDYPTFRKYASGKRTPCKLALAELERRMNETEIPPAPYKLAKIPIAKQLGIK